MRTHYVVVLRGLVLALGVLLISGLPLGSLSADPALPLARMPICGDQDGSESPLVFNCPDFVPLTDVQTFQVPGSGTVELRFDFVFREAVLNNELGFFLVDDASGSIEGLQPGDPGYFAAAFERATIIFPSGSTASTPDVRLAVNSGDILLFFIVQGDTLANLRANNPNNELGKSPLAFFSFDTLNPDGVDHFVGFENTVQEFTQFGFEDLTGGGDLDYDDVVYNVHPPLQPLAASEFTINVTSFIPVDYVPRPPVPLPFGFSCLRVISLPFPPGFITVPIPVMHGGDDRGFDPDATSYRTRSVVTVITEEASDPDGLKEGSRFRDTGVSKSYTIDALLNGELGRIDPADDDGVLHDCFLLHDVDKTDPFGMHRETTRVDEHTVEAHIFGDAANPLIPLALQLVIPISWDFTIRINTAGPTPTWTLRGQHDCYPAHEIYIDGEPIHTYMPTLHSALETFRCLAGFEPIIVNKSGHLSSKRVPSLSEEDL